jgi:hypothetical protein
MQKARVITGSSTHPRHALGLAASHAATCRESLIPKPAAPECPPGAPLLPSGGMRYHSVFTPRKHAEAEVSQTDVSAFRQY